LRAAAPPLGMGRARFTIVGDRPTRGIPWKPGLERGFFHKENS
jgi:hypothetical protein